MVSHFAEVRRAKVFAQDRFGRRVRTEGSASEWVAFHRVAGKQASKQCRHHMLFTMVSALLSEQLCVRSTTAHTRGWCFRSVRNVHWGLLAFKSSKTAGFSGLKICHSL